MSDTMMEVDVYDKATLRQVLFNKRKELSQEEIYYASEETCHRIWDLVQNLNAKTVALYIPINNEVDVMPLAETLEAHGITMCLPQVVTEGEALIFNEWLPSEDDFKTDLMGIACVDGEEMTPDLILLPTLSFDQGGNRLGYGAGYYDRTLPDMPKAVRVGVAYAFQEVEQLDVEDHDVPMHYVATDAELIEVR